MCKVVRTKAIGNNNYENDITKSVDAQIVIAPQYGNVNGVNPHLPPQSSKNTQRGTATAEQRS
jgi:hypothetical protein